MIAALTSLGFAALSPSASALDATERIVFSTIRDGNKDLYLADADGVVLKRLTTDPAEDESPRCSPDGRSVAFLRGGFASMGEIYRLDLVTGVEQRLTNNSVLDMTPQWSVDGQEIYFTTRQPGHDSIAVMKADGREVRYLTASRGWNDTMPGVSPDGRTIVHHTYRYGKDNSELHLHDLPSGATRRLTNAPGFDYEASFAGPDRVLFSSNREAKYFRLYSTSTRDGATRLLVDTGADTWGARYSPRSKNVLFYTGKDNSWQLRRTGLKGGVVHKVLRDDPPVFGADWCTGAP